MAMEHRLIQTPPPEKGIPSSLTPINSVPPAAFRNAAIVFSTVICIGRLADQCAGWPKAWTQTRHPPVPRRRSSADALLLRGSHDFDRLDDYRRFVDEIVGRRNARNARRLDSRALGPASAAGASPEDYEETIVTVTSTSGFVLRKVFNSVPSRISSAIGCACGFTTIGSNASLVRRR